MPSPPSPPSAGIPADLFAEIALDLHKHRDDPQRTVAEIVGWAQKAANCAGAGVMFLHSGRQVDAPIASSPSIQEAHDIQLTLKEGPCLDAALGTNLFTYVTHDAAEDLRYPRWGPAMAELGFHSILSAPLRTDERHYGSLNLFSTERSAFDHDDVAVTELLTRHASVAYASSQEGHGLRAAIDTRKMIGQAQGILMERYDLDADAAFEFMRRQSQTRNKKLRDIAAWIVANRRRTAIHLESDFA